MSRRSPARAVLHTGGSLVALQGSPRLLRTLAAASGGALVTSAVSERAPSGPVAVDQAADVELTIDRSTRRFDVGGGTPVTRGAWLTEQGQVVIDSVGGSGYTQRWSIAPDGLRVESRWTPSFAEQAAAKALPERFRALQAQVLLHYPVLWWSTVQGLAPLHVSTVEIDDVTVLLAGPGGVGKSTLVAQELFSGASATSDNLAVTDGTVVHGLCEPLRLDASLSEQAAQGPRTTHGRRETGWRGRVPSLRPDLVAVVRRGCARGPAVEQIDSQTAARALVAGTYAAGELSRFWALAAVLGLATGYGDVHPAVQQVARVISERLPCVNLELGTQPGARLRALLHDELAGLWHGAVS